MTMLWCFRPRLPVKDLHLAGIKGGCIFPSQQELIEKAPDDGVFKTTLSYTTTLNQLKVLCSKVLPSRVATNASGNASDDLKVGCQTWRKTGYAFGVFGGGQCEVMMDSARHKTVENARKYWKDAAVLYAKHLRRPNPANAVGKWTPILVQSHRNASIMGAYSGHHTVAFRDLGEYFVEKCLGIPKEHRRAKDIRYLLEEAMKYRSSESPREKLQKNLDQLPADKAEEFRKLTTMVLAEDMRKPSPAPPVEESAQVSTSVASIPGLTEQVLERQEQAAATHEIEAKRRKADLDDMPQRHTLKDLKTTKEKVEVMCQMWNSKQGSSKLTNGAKTFSSKSPKPVMRCLEAHFNGCVESFSMKCPNLPTSSFTTNCCAGDKETTICSPKLKKVSTPKINGGFPWWFSIPCFMSIFVIVDPSCEKMMDGWILR